MLHVLLLILKIMGIIITVILGILVLLLCVILFAPVHYRGRASSDGTLKGSRGELKVTWLFHLIRFRIVFEEEKLRWRLGIAWKIFPQNKEDEVKQYEKITVDEEKETDHEASENVEEDEKEPAQEPEVSPGSEEKDEKAQKEMEESEAGCFPEAERNPSPDEKERKSVWEKAAEKIREIKEKIFSIYRKIKYTFQGICGRIKLLSEKKEKLEKFIADEKHRHAYRVLKKELFRFLKRLLPGKLHGRIHFGFEDPYYTGRVLAGFGMLYPFLGDHLSVEPDFEERILEGDLYARGYILILDAVVLILKLVFCRDVRTTYHDVKTFEL